ncbi:hypothetical protein DFH07DRAFT_770096 [Mycena maculata]|uniref:Thioredoxin domain-containing protein n=1 Tax=Mycena maculata TaxID=230809 RepID=A0AAD7NM52_9AGAR|nr:hypothetical protein DFH07DRAFT_770096 [Mycena maculata]
MSSDWLKSSPAGTSPKLTKLGPCLHVPAQFLGTVGGAVRAAELVKKHPALLALNVEAKEQADIAESFDLEAVPSFVVLRRIAGADTPALMQVIATHAAGPVPAYTEAAPSPASETPADSTRTSDAS